jgi:hypothetical protein
LLLSSVLHYNNRRFLNKKEGLQSNGAYQLLVLCLLC